MRRIFAIALKAGITLSAVLGAIALLLFIGSFLLATGNFAPLSGGAVFVLLLQVTMPPLIFLSGLEAILLYWLNRLYAIPRPWFRGTMGLCLGLLGITLGLFLWALLKNPEAYLHYLTCNLTLWLFPQLCPSP